MYKGHYVIKWDATNYVAGIYFVQLKSKNYIMNKKIILLK